MASDQDRLIDQAMKSYGRSKPRDRNTVAKYVQDNPDYANLMRSRTGVGQQNGGPDRDDRYDTAIDSQAMKSLDKSMEEAPAKKDVAKPSPTASSGKPKSAAQSGMRSGEGVSARSGMQSERASDEIASRKDAGREAQRGKGFGNIQQPTSAGDGAASDDGNGLGTAAAGLGIGGVIGHLLNQYFKSQKPQGIGAQAPAAAAGTAVAPQRSQAMQVLDDSVIDVPFREVPPQRMITDGEPEIHYQGKPQEGPAKLEPPALRLLNQVAPQIGGAEGAMELERGVVDELNARGPQGPSSSTDPAGRNVEDVKTPNMIDRMNRRVRTPKVGRL